MSPDEDPDRHRKILILSVVAVLLVLGCSWLMLAIKQSDKTMDCIARHRTNCVPVDTNP